MLFDTHAHLDDEKFDSDRAEIIEHIRKSGVSLLVNVGADICSSYKSIELAEKYDFIYAAVGVHPYDAPLITDKDIDEIRKMASHRKVLAIGEIGLDYHFEDTDKEGQKRGFKKQLDLAKELNLPYIIHDRDSHRDCYDIIKEVGYFNGVMHCFSGSAEFAKQMVDLGLYISFAGTVTFKNAKKVKEAALYTPLDRILIETDCPYLAPEPNRGKRNDSSYVKYTLEEIAKIKNTPVSEAEAVIYENSRRFYQMDNI